MAKTTPKGAKKQEDKVAQKGKGAGRAPEPPSSKDGKPKKLAKAGRASSAARSPREEPQAERGPKGLGGVGGMDAVSAHLDRGWDLLHRNDFTGARLSAEHVMELDPRSPEGFVLVGAIAAAQGNIEEALARYEHAMTLDPTFIDPLLYSAETYIWPLGEFERAIELCEQALDLAEEEDEYLDALLLKAEAELGAGEDQAARRTLGELPEVDLPEPMYHLRAGRTLLELGEVKEAEAHYNRALERDPLLSDAVHGLGMCAEERGDRKAMVRQFLRVREMDMKEAPVPWAMSHERFEELCTHALEGLPPRIRELLANVPIIAADYPEEGLVKDGNDPRILGFFAGVPYPEQSTLGRPPHLECIFLFQRNIERISHNQEELEEEVRKTLFHEAGHFFGLSEEELEAMGLG